MKLFIQIFLIAFLSLAVNAQIPDYFGNNPTWSEVYDFEDEFEDFWPVDRVFFVSGDTLIDTTEYVIIKNTVDGEPHYGIMLFRQEGRTIYSYDNWFGKRIFISYDKEVGENFTGVKFMAPTTIIDKIDSVLIGDEYRKRFYLDTLNSAIEMIEGICIRDLSNCFGSMFQPAYTHDILQHTGAGLVENYFKVFTLDGDTILDYNWYCDNALSLAESSIPEIDIYPNPAVNLINFAGPSDIKNMIIYNLDGATIKEISLNNKTGQINLTDFSRGIYIAKITMEDGSQLRKKIILQ